MVQKIEEDSKGRLKIEIYPSATLSKPGATYDAYAVLILLRFYYSLSACS